MKKEFTLRMAITDLMNYFLMRIMDKPLWKADDVEKEFFRAMYMITLDYLDDKKQN